MKRIKIILFFLSFISLQLNAQTTVIDSFLFGGIYRDYRMYIPAIYDGSKEVPLVFNLHGYGSVNTDQEIYGDFRSIADSANFLIVHPNGTFDGNSKRFWNTFGGSNVDDVGFISALIDTVSKNFNIDSNRIYSTGMSNGGFMSHHLACFLSNRIAAIASVTGTLTHTNFNNCTPSKSTPVMQIHGTLDGTVPYIGNFAFIHVDTLIDYWVNFNNCNTQPIYTLLPDINTLDGCIAEHYAFLNGNNNSSVELYKIIGGGHSWPGATVNINITNMDFNASKEIWRFFSNYKLNQLNSIDAKRDSDEIIVFPNPANDIFFIQFNSHKMREVSIFNVIGEKIYSLSTSEILISVKLDNSGVYFIKSNDLIFPAKIIKK